MSDKIIVGLDIGTTKVCAIVGQKNEHGKINIIGLGQVPSLGGVMRGEVTNIGKTVEAIKGAISIASKYSNVEINAVHVGIAGEHIKSFQQSGVKIRENSENVISKSELLEMTKEQYRTVVDPGNVILHVLPQEYTIDNRLTVSDPEGMQGTKLECKFHIVTGRISAAKTIEKCVENAQLTASDVIVEPIASAKAVLFADEMESSIALIDIGGGTTDIAIFSGGKIRHTAVIPFGGEIITNDIAEAFGILPKQAESIKVKYGHALVEGTKAKDVIVIPGINDRKPKQIMVRNLAKVIHARMKEIMELVNQEIMLAGFYRKLTLGVVLTGGGAQMKDLTQLTQFILSTDVKIGKPDHHLGKGMVEEAKNPIYSTCMGLVLKGFEDIENTNNKNQEIPTKSKGVSFNIFSKFTGGFKEWLKDDKGDDFN